MAYRYSPMLAIARSVDTLHDGCALVGAVYEMHDA
jgi:hypothetical protein